MRHWDTRETLPLPVKTKNKTNEIKNGNKPTFKNNGRLTASQKRLPLGQRANV